MMISRNRIEVAALSLCLTFAPAAHSQANQTQQLAFAGLRSVAAQGQIDAVRTDAAGNVYLLLNQNDGVRILKMDNAGTSVLAQALLGAKGDIGLALTLDPAGNVYVTGTTTSSVLTGTGGAAIPARTDASTNSFVAKFDTNLNQLFVSFTGGSRISANALTATTDAVFVTGSLYGANLPVTGSAIEQTPATGSSQNGFVERFSSDGATLVYATYLTGVNGTTAPAGIAADASDDAYIVGSTTSTGYPTVAALVPASLSSPSGFLTKLTPAADGIVFSTFVPGPGLSSIALDSTGQILLVSGSVALGQFPVDTVASPLVPLGYQVLLRMPLDGSAVQSATVIAPGQQSFVASAPSGAAWVDGVSTAALLPGAPLATLGTGYAVRVTAANALDQTARFGGVANANPTFASLPQTITSIAVDSSGEPLIAGGIQPTASSSLLASETYDLPLSNAPTTALPSSVRSSETTAAACNGSLCSGSAAYLAKLNPAISAPSLAFSVDDAPELVLRNLGSAEATGLSLTASGATIASTCGSTLAAGAECDLLLSGTGPAAVMASTADAPVQSVSVPAYATPASTLVYSPKELDFGIQSSVSPAGARVITVTNLGSTSQTFTSALNASGTTTSPFAQTASDCAVSGSASTRLLPAGQTCHITIGFTAPSTSTSDGYLQAEWSIGSRDVLLTGYSQAASLSVSATEVDFGTQYMGGLKTPRYLYLSNSSSAPIAHTTVALAANLPFTVTDGCPATLNAASVCRIRLDYLSSTTSNDSVTLSLDQGLSVLVTGRTLPQPGVGSTVVNPNLSVTPASVTFPDAVVVTGASGTNQTVAITNSGNTSFSLSLTLTGDFTDVTSCGTILAAGQTCAVSLTFVPAQPGVRSGLLAVTAGSGTSPFYVTLSGTGLALLPVSNDAIAFGSVPVGQPSVQSFKVSQPLNSLTVTTTGPYTAVLVEDVGYGFGQPAASAYSAAATGACPNCFVGVQFIPGAIGSQPGTLTLTSSGGGTSYTIALSGSGAGTSGLVLTPAASDFGSVPVHSSSAPTLFTLTNLIPTGLPVDLSSITFTGDFAASAAVTGGQPCTGSLAYTASCLVEVAFSPTATGSRTGSFTVTANAGTATATLTGTGTADPGFALNPNALAFTNVPGATATQQTITLTNTGAATLQAGAPTVGTSNFTATSTCGSLAVGSSCALVVTFFPGAANVTDTLSLPITSTAAGGGSTSIIATIPLSGAYTTSTSGLQIVPAQANFSAQPTGSQGESLLLTLNNLTAKTQAINLIVPHGFALSGTPCTSVAANGSCTFSIQFIPLTNGPVTGSFLAQGTPADGSAPVGGLGYLEGYGVGSGPLTLSGPLQSGNVLNFGQVASGQSVSQTLLLANKNAAGSAPITIRQITSAPPFLTTNSCGGALAVGASCAVTVIYAPINQIASGSAATPATPNNGLLTIASDATSSPDIVNLTGQAAPAAVASPSNASVLDTYSLSEGSLIFGTTPVGNNSAAQTVSLTNTGNTTIHVNSVTTTANFTVDNGCASVTAGTGCILTVTSTPQTAGTHIDSLEISSDATDSLEYVSLLSGAMTSTLTITPRVLNFGAELVGMNAQLGVLVTNTGATSTLFNGITATGDYTPGGNCPAAGASLAAGQQCTITVMFAPTQAGTRTGALSVATAASATPLTVSLSGIGMQGALAIAPASLAFGSVAQGSSAALLLTLTNTGSVPITGLAFGVTGDFAVSFPCSTTTLAPGASCNVQIVFSPSALGARTGTLSITSSDPASPAAVALSGTGVVTVLPAGKLVFAPANLVFGNVALGTSAVETVTLANGGTAPLTNLAASLTGDYLITVPCGTTTLTPGASCTVQVTFTPAALGARPGVLTVTSSDPASPAMIPLTGTGVAAVVPVQAGGFTLTVDGAASASATVASGSPGGYTLTVTPTGGFAGPIALTCSPITAGEYATCSLQPSNFAINGTPQNAVVVLNTITSAASLERPGRTVETAFACMLLPGLLACWKARRRLQRRLPVLLALLFTAFALLATGCGGKGKPSNSAILETPPGTYQYQVTASATGGSPASQTVTLTLIVQ